jgi:hypothetical protein
MKHKQIVAVVVFFVVSSAHAEGGRGFRTTNAAAFAPTVNATLGATASSVVGATSATAPSSYEGSYKGGNYYSWGAPSYANGAACPMGQFPFIGGTYGWEECSALYRADWLMTNVGKAAAIRYLCSKDMMEEGECRSNGWTNPPKRTCNPFSQAPC